MSGEAHADSSTETPTMSLSMKPLRERPVSRITLLFTGVALTVAKSKPNFDWFVSRQQGRSVEVPITLGYDTNEGSLFAANASSPGKGTAFVRT
ncbi:uncharacterized protein BJX67DRAFT_367553 [Aspergillus lucknowensis]|uniref:Uncharacterized protein n=1 Tax=Aspergillus lucknowensis TaxID=176173 RepID=A0ABR4L8Y2_9EURO